MDDDEIEAWWAKREAETRPAHRAKTGELIVCTACGWENPRARKNCEQCGTCQSCPE